MRKVFILFWLTFSSLTIIFAQDYSMYVDGKKRHYKVSPDKILIQYFDDNIDSVKIKNFLQRVNVNSRSITKVYNGELMVVDLENVSKENFSNLIEQWNVLETNAYVSPVISGEDNFEMSVISNQILVRVKQENDHSLLVEKLRSHNVKAIKSCDLDNKRYLITINDAQQKNSLQIANELYETGLFDYAEPNMFHFIKRNTIDTHFGQQWALKNTGQSINGVNGTAGIDIKAELAWTITTGFPSVKIALLDSGVDLSHPDLAGNLVQGYNASTNLPNGDVEYRDGMYEHGTACAGIIAAVANNGEGVAGIAYNCKIIPIYDGLRTDHLVRGIDWARNNGASVISISTTYGETTALNTAFDQAGTIGRNNLGCIIVASSGNGSSATVGYPARHPYVISVGANNNQGYRASFSNYGTNLDVVAPGVGIYTTDLHGIQGKPGYTPIGNLYYDNFGGTSASCPHVSGVAALVLSVNSTLTRQQVKDIIESTAQKINPNNSYIYSTTSGRPNGTWNNQMGYGLVNAHAAVQAAQITLPYNVIGTVFPFVYYNYPPLDNLFNITASLYAVPAYTTKKSVVINAVLNSAPVCSTTVVRYDAAIHYVPGTPKNPGYIGALDNPGEPIDWSIINKIPGTPDNTPAAPGEQPTCPVGLYSFPTVAPGNYLLVLSRLGYVIRLTEITVPQGGILFAGHRELVAGDVNGDHEVDVNDVNDIYYNLGYNYFYDPQYNAKYDLNGSGDVDIGDVSLAKGLQGFKPRGYLDTQVWFDKYQP
jgi:subtilisin family serine protease